MMKKVLFVAHSATAGHAGRLLIIAEALQERFDGTIEFAGSGKYGSLFTTAGFRFHELQGADYNFHQGKHEFVHMYAQSKSVKERIGLLKKVSSLFRQMIAYELKLYSSVRPDLIVWDGRVTAAISAEVACIPFISVMNTVLTPYSRIRGGFPKTFPLLTSHPWLRGLITQLPLRGQQWLFDRCLEVFFLCCVRFMNKLRSSFGLPVFPNPKTFYCPGLRTVIIPEPEIFSPITSPPHNFRYVGPVAWQPQMGIPEPLRSLQDIIYMSMGTTGNPLVFKPVRDALASMSQWPVVVTAGDLIEIEALRPLPEHVHVYPFLPGVDMAKRARLMICHGALATLTQALSRGVPVLTIPYIFPHEVWSNMVEGLGAALKLYGYELTPQKVHSAVEQLLTEETYRRVAQDLAPQCQLKGGPERAAELILSELGELNAAKVLSRSA